MRMLDRHQMPWEPKDSKLFVIEYLGHCSGGLILSYICLNKSSEMVDNDQDIFRLRLFPQISWYLHLDEIDVDQIHWFSG